MCPHCGLGSCWRDALDICVPFDVRESDSIAPDLVARVPNTATRDLPHHTLSRRVLTPDCSTPRLLRWTAGFPYTPDRRGRLSRTWSRSSWPSLLSYPCGLCWLVSWSCETVGLWKVNRSFSDGAGRRSQCVPRQGCTWAGQCPRFILAGVRPWR